MSIFEVVDSIVLLGLDLFLDLGGRRGGGGESGGMERTQRENKQSILRCGEYNRTKEADDPFPVSIILHTNTYKVSMTLFFM